MRGNERDIHRGIQPQGLIQHGAQVLHLLDVLHSRPALFADVLEDLLAQLRKDVGVLGEHVHREGRKAGNGVAPRDRDIQQLVAQHLDI